MQQNRELTVQTQSNCIVNHVNNKTNSNMLAFSSETPESKNADAKSTTSKTSISVKLPSANTDDQRKSSISPSLTRRNRTPVQLQVIKFVMTQPKIKY